MTQEVKDVYQMKQFPIPLSKNASYIIMFNDIVLPVELYIIPGLHRV